jgi:hypothetical protein
MNIGKANRNSHGPSWRGQKRRTSRPNSWPQQMIAGREWLFQQGYPDQSPVQKAIRELAAKLDMTAADNGQNTRRNSAISFSL